MGVMNLKNRYYDKVQSVLCSNGFYEHDVCYILKNTKSEGELFAMACSRFHADEYLMIEIDGKQRSTVRYIESAYQDNEYHLFRWLEMGYELQFMSMDYHAQVWCDIAQRQEELDWSEGKYIYIEYCRIHSITKRLLDCFVDDTDDIMQLGEIYGY